MMFELAKVLNFLAVCSSHRVLESNYIFVKKSILPFLRMVWREGFIIGYSVTNNKIIFFFKLDVSSKNALNDILVVSKKLKCFLTWYQIKQVLLSDLRIVLIVRTHKGVFSNFKLFQNKIGGELLIKIN